MRFSVYSGFTKVARCPTFFLFVDVNPRPIIQPTNSPDSSESYTRTQLENFSCVIRRLCLKAGVNHGLAGQMLGLKEKLLLLLLLSPILLPFPGQWDGKEFSGMVT
ncbi:uncharacterized protein CDAR_393901 [Caerostris darwini]|uniref:Uncharacterized protein n=1 Tax=Caerostris darwini TaxID=1538125 RepID=A0AAV4QTP0_9ARAC|nr:hypothetical protein CDAR_584731 [Caerostris darwini]GIY47516.1 uncharacterized protein CDAR_393901 [Caerostris darwini]